MNRKTRLTTVLVIIGAAGVAAVALAAPAIAGVGPFARPTATATGPGNRMGNGMGFGAGAPTGMRSGTGMGMGYGNQAGICGITAPSGPLTDPQKATLVAMAQEEKLAGDLYQNFADKYPAVVFDRIAASEDQHLAAVRTLLSRYGITDPTAGQPVGQFTSATVQATYDRLLAQGQADQNAALTVGKQVEQTDITDLQKALDGLTAPDVTQVYQHLFAASRHHLTAFTSSSTR